MSKTLFLALERGLVCRNILRTGVLDALLENPEHRVVILLPKRPEGIPEYLRAEFRHPRVFLEEVPERSDSFWLTRLWLPVVNNLVYTTFTDTLAREGSGKVKPVPKWRYPMHRKLFSTVSKWVWLKAFARWLDRLLFRAKGFGPLFEKYQPTALFSGSIISKYDIAALKAAKQFGIPSVGMQKGWDNLQKQLIRHIPDVFLLQNARMQEPAMHIQHIPAQRIRIVGFPQFDGYVNRGDLPTREEFCASLHIDPAAKIVFYGSEGLWTPKDDERIDELLNMRAEGAFPFSVHFIVRPHFSDISKARYARFHGIPGVTVDDGFRWGKYFADWWDPSREDMRHFVAELAHADVMVGFASTLSLDAACMDLPIVSIGYGCMFSPEGRDMTMNLYQADHYLPVMESDAAELVTSADALKSAIIRSIQDRGYRSDGRKRLRESMCGMLDSHSAKRVADAILSV